MNRMLKYTAALLATGALALAEVPTEISGLVTDATTVFGTVKTLVLSIVTFFVLLWVVKKVRAR